MAQDATEVVVGANGDVYVAPVGTNVPADVDDPLDPAFSEALGFVSEDGVTATDGKTTTNIGAWQSFYPLRTIVTERNFTVAFVLRQWNQDTVSLAFGGGTFEATGSFTKYTPPDPSILDERVLIVDWADGDDDYRLVVPRCIVSEDVASQITRTNAADLPITMTVLAPAEGDDPWFLFTNAVRFSS
jgi:hypothetical protein